jgi:hypothetical protein
MGLSARGIEQTNLDTKILRERSINIFSPALSPWAGQLQSLNKIGPF